MVLQISVDKSSGEDHAGSTYSDKYKSVPCGTPAGSPPNSAAVNEVGFTQVQLPSVSLIIHIRNV